MSEYGDPDLETVAPLPPLPSSIGETSPPGPPGAPFDHRPSDRQPVAAVIAALVVVSLIVGFGVATLVLNARDTNTNRAASGTSPALTVPAPSVPGTTPGSTAPPLPADPDEGVLATLIVNQRDVPVADTVHHLPHGADTTVATLDLCNGTFPSEAQRTARRQVALADANDDVFLSTEAILYRAPEVGVEAFKELQSVAAKCPSTPVKSSAGEDTATTKILPPPDKAWPHTPTVERLAYDFDTVDATTGDHTHSIAVYLRRGRVLMGVYFAEPDKPQLAVDGKTTIAGIEAVFEQRIARLPASAISG